MGKGTIALFAESDQGPFKTFNHINSVSSLYSIAGNLRNNSAYKLVFSALEMGYDVLFWRVTEEGMDTPSYLEGLSQLRKTHHIIACYLPGVSEAPVLLKLEQLCKEKKSIILMQEPDLYDLLAR